MAYQTGTANDVFDLIETIELFADANGWDINSNVISKDSCFVRLTAIDSNFGIRIEGSNSSGFSSPNLCPGWARVYVKEAEWPVSYHLFAHSNPSTIICFINHNVNFFQHIAFGVARKYGTWVGGNWFSASMNHVLTETPSVFLASSTYLPATDILMGEQANSSDSIRGNGSGGIFLYSTYGNNSHGNSFIHAEIDGANWCSCIQGNGTFPQNVHSSIHTRNLINLQPNAWNGQAVLIPFHLWTPRAENKASLIGEIPHIRHLRIDHYNPGDILTIGVEEWKIFPWVRKNAEVRNGAFRSRHSGTFGVAVRYDGP